MEPDERQKKRLELERPVLDAFWKWIDGMNALGGSKLAKAIEYAIHRGLNDYMICSQCIHIIAVL